MANEERWQRLEHDLCKNREIKPKFTDEPSTLLTMVNFLFLKILAVTPNMTMRNVGMERNAYK